MNIDGATATTSRPPGSVLSESAAPVEDAGVFSSVRQAETEEQRFAAQFSRQEQAASEHILALTVAYANFV